MRPVEPRPTCGRKRPYKVQILWDAGESFEIVLEPTSKLYPRTLITYFPALAVAMPRSARLIV